MPVLTRSGPKRHRALIVRPGKRQSLTAAAQPAAESGGALLRLDQTWQREAMRQYRTCGECWNPAQYFARSMERIRFYPAKRSSRGIPEEITSGPVLELFQRMRAPGGAPGDLSELAGAYGRLQFLIGDGMLTVSRDYDDEEAWEYLSPMELRLQPHDERKPQEYRRHRAPGVLAEELSEASDADFAALGGDAHVWRLWRRHPEYSQWSDSPIRPTLDLYETLNRLTLAVAAEATSRAAQRGLLFVPDELSFGPVDTTQEENPEDDPLIRELQGAMARAIQDPGSAEAMAPFVLRAPGVTTTAGAAVPTAELIRWIQLGPQDRYAEGEMWDKTIARIAGALDLPKEMLTGIEDVSHWSAWFLDEVGFRQHTGPTVLRFCNDIAAAYLRPAARDANVDGADDVTVWYDPSQAINHPDETGTAKDAHDRLVVSDEWYREKIGAPDDAAPDEDEAKRRTEIKLKQMPEEYVDEPAQAPAGEVPPQEGGRGGDTQEGPPAGTEERPPGTRPPSPAGPNLAMMIAGAAQMQIDRARELAGNRLWRIAQSCGECRDVARDVKPGLIASAFGADAVREMLNGRTEATLVDGIGASLARVLREWDVDGGWPEQLGAMVEQHALRTLYQERVPPLPPGFWAACQKASVT